MSIIVTLSPNIARADGALDRLNDAVMAKLGCDVRDIALALMSVSNEVRANARAGKWSKLRMGNDGGRVWAQVVE